MGVQESRKNFESAMHEAFSPLTGASAVPDDVMIALLEQSRDCVKILGIGGTLDFMNCGGLDALELEDFEGVRGKLWWKLWPEHTQELVKKAFERARAGFDVQFSAECPTQRGNMRHWAVSLKPMTTDEGHVVGVLCTSRDVPANGAK